MKKIIALLAAMAMCMMSLPAFAYVEMGKSTIGDVTHASLANALYAAKDGDTIVMQENCYLNGASPLTQSIKCNVTIDLNNYSIVYDNYMLSIIFNKNVTIKNGTISSTTSAIKIDEGSHLTLDNVNVTNTSSSNPAILVEGDLDMVNSTVASSTNEALKIVNSNVTLENSNISSKTFSAIEIDSNSSLTLENTDVTSTSNTDSTIVTQGKLDIIDSTVTSPNFEALKIDGGDVTISGSKSSVSAPESDVEYKYGAIYILNGGSLVINDGTIKADDYHAIYGNGSTGLGNTTITINGGTVESTAGTGMYIPQSGTVNITGGTVKGSDAGIEIESGALNISGGTISGGTKEFVFLSPKAQGNKEYDGNTVAGVAVAAVCRTPESGSGYAGDMEINITGGTFNGVYGFAKLIYKNMSGTLMSEQESMKSLNISGGTFNGVNSSDGQTTGQAVYVGNECENKTFITGGTFNTDVRKYVAEGYGALNVDGQYEVAEKASATTGTVAVDDNKDDVEQAMGEAGFTGENAGYQLDTATVNGVTGNTIFVNYTFNENTPYTLKFETANLENTNVKLGIVLYNIPESTTISDPSVYIQ